ncbi:MAG TPA: CBO0543 family protein [Methylomusa anaerophila]|uniref:Uncharacterized protein n=1 Tax=Methylomusa anaerophila TaxID=1930071 RepID=A0A348AMM5_9FIRM|nr:CBO0543 family protein [Methylomusa anaerophila]BBB92323.1 hypothetical protein MAMMFC1_03016 [Methylomusa anaerophila]HML90037.1 CBO0543 family protein [Methylomusa anaerophila]
MFYIIWFILSWIVWLRFADRARWREMLPVVFFAKTLALATDLFVVHYPLWEYVGPLLFIHLADDLGIYPVVIYLFIQWLPDSHTIKPMLKYWLVWTTIAVIIELIYVISGHMRYHLWWNTWHSYAADWFLYWLFYQYHRILKLERLSANR